MFKFISNSKKAFTLLELLVVIGIIGILVGVGVSSYSTAQQKARDSRRKTDIKEIQSALEQYYSICGFQYPDSLSSGIICTNTDPATTILNPVSTDPKTGSSYQFTQSTSSDYRICATLEADKGNQPELDGTFCFNNQQ